MPLGGLRELDGQGDASIRASRERESCDVVSWALRRWLSPALPLSHVSMQKTSASSALRIVPLDHDSKHRRVPEMLGTRHVRPLFMTNARRSQAIALQSPCAWLSVTILITVRSEERRVGKEV